jgi:hypothetical protein
MCQRRGRARASQHQAALAEAEAVHDSIVMNEPSLHPSSPQSLPPPPLLPSTPSLRSPDASNGQRAGGPERTAGPRPAPGRRAPGQRPASAGCRAAARRVRTMVVSNRAPPPAEAGTGAGRDCIGRGRDRGLWTGACARAGGAAVAGRRPAECGRRWCRTARPRPPRPGRVLDVIALAEAGTGACGPGPVLGPAARHALRSLWSNMD